jgi:hypothetical protein
MDRELWGLLLFFLEMVVTLFRTSKAVVPKAYCEALTSVLDETIEKIQKRMNWQKGDTIRLIFILK